MTPTRRKNTTPPLGEEARAGEFFTAPLTDGRRIGQAMGLCLFSKLHHRWIDSTPRRDVTEFLTGANKVASSYTTKLEESFSQKEDDGSEKASVLREIAAGVVDSAGVFSQVIASLDLGRVSHQHLVDELTNHLGATTPQEERLWMECLEKGMLEGVIVTAHEGEIWVIRKNIRLATSATLH